MKPSQSPSLTRFFSDFTLGFSDGLTVPFALTAGLSSLGSTDTVISGGLAELCAGCISMGIGGYLAARDEVPPAHSNSQQQRTFDEEEEEEEEARGMLSYDGDSESSARLEVTEKSSDSAVHLIQSHLEPLALPPAIMSTIMTTLQSEPNRATRAIAGLQSYHEKLSIRPSNPLPISPLLSGLSISLGYTIGGIIPLCPYFFAATVGLGLRWSICLCLIALFTFGSGKSWVLRGEGLGWRCVWEGLQMLILGMLAAGTAVACVSLMEGGISHK
ncbi:Ccc1 family [Dactylonectria estremocensis]|uniref:Ccc1 family n=1 Tax=Dactylonectria estremocensis TaxID=1079267 RepID=A0A9P9JDA6_9HYPO|nr:Ccc1 family [Dactylonectria estremocensis]